MDSSAPFVKNRIRTTESSDRSSESSSTVSALYSGRSLKPVVWFVFQSCYQREHSLYLERFFTFLRCAELLKAQERNQALLEQILRGGKAAVPRKSLLLFLSLCHSRVWFCS